MAVTPVGKIRAGEVITLDIYKRVWRSKWTETEHGEGFRDIEKLDERAGTYTVITKEEPVSVSFTPAEPGFYLIRASGIDERQMRILTISGFYAPGLDLSGWGNDDGRADILMAVLNRGCLWSSRSSCPASLLKPSICPGISVEKPSEEISRVALMKIDASGAKKRAPDIMEDFRGQAVPDHGRNGDNIP